MATFDHGDPMRRRGVSRYPGTFMLALREAFARLNWKAVAWKGSHVDCVDDAERSHQVGLENLYRRLRREPRASWPDAITELLASVPAEIADTPPVLCDVAERLLVRLGPPLTEDDPAIKVWRHVLVERQIVITLVIDYPNSMSYVSTAMVEESGETGEYWLRQALANLRCRGGAEGLPIVHEESGLHQGQFGDAYDSSRALILDDLLPGHDEFGFYVIIPSRDHLLVLPISAQTISLAPWLRAIAHKTHQEMAYPISPELYWVRQGVWHHFVIEIKGEEVFVTPPIEFADVLERLQSDDGESAADSTGDEPDPLPF